MAQAIVSFLATLGLILSLTPAIASAQDTGANSESSATRFITKITLTRLKGRDEPLLPGERVEFGFEWDASRFAGTDSAPKPGDKLIVALPEWAKFPDGKVNMTNKAGQVVAKCVQSPARVECTLTDFVTGKQELNGWYKSALYLKEIKTITQRRVQVGPFDVFIDINSIAGEDAINNGVVGEEPNGTQPKRTPLPNDQSKIGIYHGVNENTEGKAAIEWQIIAQGTGRDIVIHDTFTRPLAPSGYVNALPNWKDSVEIRYRDREKEGSTGGDWDLLSGLPNETSNLPAEKYDVEWSRVEDGRNKATITIKDSGASKVYRVRIMTEVEASFHQAGDKISNTAWIDSDEVRAEAIAYNVLSAFASGRNGFGDVIVYKTVTGLADKDMPDDYTVQVQAEISRPNSDRPEEQLLTIRPGDNTADAARLSDLPAGTKVVFSEVNAPNVLGYQTTPVVFGEGKLGELEPRDDVKLLENKQKVEVTVRNQGVTVINATNTYTREAGSFKIAKVLAGDAQDRAVGPFVFHYRCGGAGEWTAVSVNEGETKEITNIPVGQCVIKEIAPAEIEEVTHHSVLVVGDKQARDGAELSFDVVKDASPIVTVQATNTYTHDRGELQIKKVVAGDAKNLAPASFSFAVRCGEKEWDNVEVADGAFAAITDAPVGECEIREKNASVAGTTVVTGFSVNGQPAAVGQDGALRVRVAKGATVLVEATNTYTRDVGSIELRKNVIVDGKAAPSTTPFSIIARCEGMQLDPITVPGDGSAVRIDAVPTGTTCSFTEADAQRPGFAHGVKIEPASVMVNNKNEQVRVNVTNTYTRDTGGFSIAKKVEGNAAARAPKRFHFHYTCADGVSGNVEVEPGKPVMVSDIPTGECTVTEQAAPAQHTTVTTQMSINGGQPVETNSVTFAVTKDNNSAVAVVATNTYTADEYPFMLRKTISADSDLEVLKQRIANHRFLFDYTCTPAYPGAKATGGTLSVAGDGTPVASPHTYPVGTTCTLTERADHATIEGFVHTPVQPVKITVTADAQPAVVSVDNHYTRGTAGFSLAKKVRGWPWFANNTFTFNYRCEHPSSNTLKEGTVEVAGNNTSVHVEANIPFGSHCVITEDTQKAQRIGFFLQEVPEIRFTLDEKNKDHTFTATNTYIPWIPLLIPLIPLVVAPFIPHLQPQQETAVLAATPHTQAPTNTGHQKPQHTPQAKTAQLARTGVDKHLLLWVLVGVMLAVTGAVILRRRES